MTQSGHDIAHTVWATEGRAGLWLSCCQLSQLVLSKQVFRRVSEVCQDTVTVLSYLITAVKFSWTPAALRQIRFHMKPCRSVCFPRYYHIFCLFKHGFVDFPSCSVASQMVSALMDETVFGWLWIWYFKCLSLMQTQLSRTPLCKLWLRLMHQVTIQTFVTDYSNFCNWLFKLL